MHSYRIPAHGPLDPIPSFSVRENASKEEQMQYTLDINRGLYDIDLTHRLEDLKVDQDLWASGTFVITRAKQSGLSNFRDPTRHDGKDVLCISALPSGLQRSLTTGSISRDIVEVYSANAIEGTEMKDCEGTTLYVPFDLIGYDPSKHETEYNLALNSSVGKVIGTALTDVTARLPYTPSQDVPAMIGQVTDLTRDLVLGNRDHVNRANLNRARRLAMDAFIEDNLNNPMLHATKHLQQEFNVSRATLYRMFDADGGVEAYVTRRRLHRSLIALKNAAPKRGVIRNVSEAFGFFDASNFNRAFKSEFGFKPSEVVGVRGGQSGFR